MFLAQKQLLRAANLAGKPVIVTRVVDTMTGEGWGRVGRAKVGCVNSMTGEGGGEREGEGRMCRHGFGRSGRWETRGCQGLRVGRKRKAGSMLTCGEGEYGGGGRTGG